MSDAVIVDGRVGGAALTLCDCLGLVPVALDVAELSLSSSRIFAASARYACLFGIAVSYTHLTLPTNREV